jgi:Zn-dependent peptidase ImmA (M78 family)
VGFLIIFFLYYFVAERLMDKVKYINKKNLMIARENIGLSTFSASKKISTSKADLVLVWEKGESLPTWPQLNKLAKLYNISELLLCSKVIVEKNKTIPDYRAGQVSESNERVARLINFVIKRQKWLEQKFKDANVKNDLQGSGKDINSPKKLAKFIKEKLKISLEDIKNVSGFNAHRTTLNYLIQKAEDNGIFVGKTVSYHKIAVSDLRGLFISSDYCPFIVINRKDAVSAQIFSFIHELAHLFRKTDAISNSLAFRRIDNTINKEEIFCNKVAAELLLPEEDFEKLSYDKTDIDALAKIYKVSKLVIFYRLKDMGKINERIVNHLEKEIKEESDKNIAIKNAKKKDGGNHINNMKDSNGRLFNNVISGLYFENKIGYTEASSLLNFSVEKI